MAKKTIRSEQSSSPTNLPAPDRRRKVRDTANDLRTQGDGKSATTPTFEQIAEAAYRRYLQRGGQHGHDFDDWIDAERELRASR
jgi:hypothetical protein